MPRNLRVHKVHVIHDWAWAGMMHRVLEIFDQLKLAKQPHNQGISLLAAIFLTVKAVQAAVTLGTGCSLGHEGPSVDIGKSCALRCSEIMENNRERRIALVAAGAAAGIASDMSSFGGAGRRKAGNWRPMML
ncbi:Chloride channel protein CLC-f [Hordeum vulgare]|nr:Chloride channel protein CLC-f [Hordeum vulgare]